MIKKISSFFMDNKFKNFVPTEQDFWEKTFDRNSFSSYIPIIDYDDENGYFVMDNGYIGEVFECVPYIYPSISVFRDLKSLYASDFPDGTEIHFTIWAGDYLEPLVEKMKSLREKNDFWSELSSRFILENTRKGPNDVVSTPFRDFRFLVSIKIPIPLILDINNKEVMNEFYLKVSSYFEDFKAKLTAKAFYPKRLNGQDLLTFLYMILNPGHDKRLTPVYSKHEKFRDQVIMSDTPIERRRDSVYIDGHYCSALSVKNYPENFTFEDIFDFIGKIENGFDQISCPFIFSFGAKFEGHDKMAKAQSSKNKKILKQDFADEALPRLKERRDEARFIDTTMVKNKLLRGSLTWWLYSDDREKLRIEERKVFSLADEKKFVLQKEPKQGNLFQLMNVLPLCSDAELDKAVFKRYVTMFDYNASHLTPYYADWKGTPTPVLYFFTRRGQIVFYDLFYTGQAGFNFIVVARTGSGKSFFTNHLISGYYSLPDVSNIWIIDIGKSYEAICKLYNGTFIDFGERDITINPFDVINDFDTGLAFFTSVYGKMAKPTEPLSDNEANVLGSAIRDAYKKKGKETCVDDIYEELLKIEEKNSHESVHANALRIGLNNWKSDGVYGKYVNGKTNIDIKNKLTVLELKALEGNDQLREVMLMLFLYIITDKVIVEDDRTKKKIAIIDEFWKYVDNKPITNFVLLAYKTWRKHGASIGTVTQEITDYYKNSSMQGILNNAAHKFLLKQTNEAIAKFEQDKSIDLSKGEYDLMRTVTTVKGKYSEIFFLTPVGNGIVRLLVNKPLYWIYTTEAKEAALREEKTRKNNGDILKGVMECIETTENKK